MIEATPNRASILIIDANEQVRSLLESLLEADHEYTVSRSARDAMRMLEAIKFDLVSTDTDIGGSNGSHLVPYVSPKSPKTVVVMMRRESLIDEAIRVIPAVAQGETYLSPPVPTIRHCCSRIDAAACPFERLTVRQTQVLRLIADGKTTKQIALELNISVKTVESHRVRLMNRLGIHEIAGLVRFAISVGLVRLED